MTKTAHHIVHIVAALFCCVVAAYAFLPRFKHGLSNPGDEHNSLAQMRDLTIALGNDINRTAKWPSESEFAAKCAQRGAGGDISSAAQRLVASGHRLQYKKPGPDHTVNGDRQVVIVSECCETRGVIVVDSEFNVFELEFDAEAPLSLVGAFVSEDWILFRRHEDARMWTEIIKRMLVRRDKEYVYGEWAACLALHRRPKAAPGTCRVEVEGVERTNVIELEFNRSGVVDRLHRE